MKTREIKYDVVRSFCILTVFFYHIFNVQASSYYVKFFWDVLALGLLMSLLGFISAILLTRDINDFGEFFIKRLSRIYIPLLLCMSLMMTIHYFQGKPVLNQQSLMHLIGFSGLLDLFGVPHISTIGEGLWFVTSIIVLYICLPSFRVIFKHKNSLIHLIILLLFLKVLHYVMWGTESFFDVATGFVIGVYLRESQNLDKVAEQKFFTALIFSIVLLGLSAMAKAGIIPESTRKIVYTFFPFGFIPLLFSLTKNISKSNFLSKFIVFFASLSYEFYILHFYFINKNFYEIFPRQINLSLHIIISFSIVLVLSFIISRIAAFLRNILINYVFLRQPISHSIPVQHLSITEHSS